MLWNETCMSWNVMIVTGIDLLWDLRIDLKCQRGLRMSYRMQTGALILVTMSWIYHQTCSGGATWGKAAMYMGDFGPLYILFQPISISQSDFSEGSGTWWKVQFKVLFRME